MISSYNEVLEILSILNKSLPKNTSEKYLHIVDCETDSEIIKKIRNNTDEKIEDKLKILFKTLFNELSQNEINILLIKEGFSVYTLSNLFFPTMVSLHNSHKINDSYYTCLYLNYIHLTHDKTENQFSKNALSLYNLFSNDNVYNDDPDSYLFNYALNNKNFHVFYNYMIAANRYERYSFSDFAEKTLQDLNTSEDMNIFLTNNFKERKYETQSFLQNAIPVNNNEFQLNYLQLMILTKGHLMDENQIVQFIRDRDFYNNLDEKISLFPSLFDNVNKNTLRIIFKFFPEINSLYEKNILTPSIQDTSLCINKKRI